VCSNKLRTAVCRRYVSWVASVHFETVEKFKYLGNNFNPALGTMKKVMLTVPWGQYDPTVKETRI